MYHVVELDVLGANFPANSIGTSQKTHSQCVTPHCCFVASALLWEIVCAVSGAHHTSICYRVPCVMSQHHPQYPPHHGAHAPSISSTSWSPCTLNILHIMEHSNIMNHFGFKSTLTFDFPDASPAAALHVHDDTSPAHCHRSHSLGPPMLPPALQNAANSP